MEDKKKNDDEKKKAKFLKEQARKKEMIAEYKKQKLEAEDMLANADLPESDDDDYNHINSLHKPGPGFDEYKMSKDNFGQSMTSDVVAYGKSGGAKVFKKQKPQQQPEWDEDEDRYLDDIINRKYDGKAPPAIN